MGAVRCGDCQKFASLDPGEPELQQADISCSKDSVEVTANIRIVRVCADCGGELKEAYLDLETTITLDEFKEHKEEVKDHLEELELEEGDINSIEEGGSRYAKSYFGAEFNFSLKLNDKVVFTGTMSDKVAASDMEEM